VNPTRAGVARPCDRKQATWKLLMISRPGLSFVKHLWGSQDAIKAGQSHLHGSVLLFFKILFISEYCCAIKVAIDYNYRYVNYVPLINGFSQWTMKRGLCRAATQLSLEDSFFDMLLSNNIDKTSKNDLLCLDYVIPTISHLNELQVKRMCYFTNSACWTKLGRLLASVHKSQLFTF